MCAQHLLPTVKLGQPLNCTEFAELYSYAIQSNPNTMQSECLNGVYVKRNVQYTHMVSHMVERAQSAQKCDTHSFIHLPKRCNRTEIKWKKKRSKTTVLTNTPNELESKYRKYRDDWAATPTNSFSHMELILSSFPFLIKSLCSSPAHVH